MQPVATGRRRVGSGGLDQTAADAPVPPLWIHGCVKQEGMSATIPAHLYEAHQAPGVEGAHPGQGVPLQALAPRRRLDPAVKSSRVQSAQLMVVDREARHQLNGHADTL